MKGLKFDLNIPKLILKKLHLAGKYNMIIYKEDWNLPKIKYPNQVILKTRACGICGSDMHQILVEISYFPSIMIEKENPSVLGHELVAIVEEVGEDVEEIKIGDRVILNPVPHCEAYGFKKCPSCENGNWGQCYCLTGVGDGTEKEEEYGGRGAFGGHIGGGFTEHLVAFEKQLYKVPENVPDKVALLTEPYAVALFAALKNIPKPSDKVIVVGAGTIGLLLISALKSLNINFELINIARYPYQAEMSKKMGADIVICERDEGIIKSKIAEITEAKLFKPTLSKEVVFGDLGPDIIFDCVATESSMDMNIRMIRSNGKIVVVGLGYSVTKKIDWAIPVYKELEIIGSMMQGLVKFNGSIIDPFEKALSEFSKNPKKFEDIVTHFFAIDNYKRAFNLMLNKSKEKAIKIAFNYQ